MPGAARIGNDVVDLGDERTATSHLRPRFVARVCNDLERARVQASADPARLLWSLFAAKEAAYKTVSKQQPGIIFAHRQFCVANDLRAVRYGDVTVRLRIERTGDCIHAVAELGPANTPVLQGVKERADGDDPSRAVRALLIERLADDLGCARAALAVERPAAPQSWTGHGPPRLVRDGLPTDRDISLSHHGRFVAFAAIGNHPPARFEELTWQSSTRPSPTT